MTSPELRVGRCGHRCVALGEVLNCVKATWLKSFQWPQPEWPPLETKTRMVPLIKRRRDGLGRTKVCSCLASSARAWCGVVWRGHGRCELIRETSLVIPMGASWSAGLCVCAVVPIFSVVGQHYCPLTLYIDVLLTVMPGVGAILTGGCYEAPFLVGTN